MLFGYMDRICRIDLSSGQIQYEKSRETMYRKYIGGYGVGARLLLSEMRANVDPLGPENILGFVIGPLTGTQAQIGSRFTVVCKSPLTTTWGDANAGGWFGPKMKHSGFDTILFRGISPHPVILVIKDGKAILKEADDLWGLDTFQTEDALKQEFGNKAEIACIGPAGEKLSLISGIVCNKGRLAARSGVGAVMGSKKLKAIVALGDMTVPVAEEQRLKELREKYIKTQCVYADMYKTVGTPGLVESAALTGDLPTKNWSSSVGEEGLDYSSIGGDAVLEHQKRKWGCYKCSIACGGVMEGIYEDEEKTNFTSHKPEYESIAALGPLCNNDDLISIIKASDLCNRYGLDTISAGATIAFAMDLFDRGIIDFRSTKLDLSWGNAETILDLVKGMGTRQGFGDVLADGVKAAVGKIGKEASDVAYHIMGQELPMHDPKYFPGLALGYHLDDTPGRHMHNNGWAITAPEFWLEGIGIEDPDTASYLGQGKNFMILSAQSHFINALGACMMGWLSNHPSYIYDFYSAVTGWECDKEIALRAGERIANVRHAFNLREGHNPKSWTYPGMMIGDPSLKNGPLRNTTIDLDSLEREWLEAYHWDVETTLPDKQHLETLGIPELWDELGLK